MENQRYVNRFWSLELTYPGLTYEPVVDCERWFQGTDKTWGEYSEPDFDTLSELDRYIVLKGIFAARAYEDRPRRLLLKYFKKCKVLLEDLDITEPMYDVMTDIVRDMHDFIYVNVCVSEGVTPFSNDTYDHAGFISNGLPVKVQAQMLTNKMVMTFMLCAKRTLDVKQYRVGLYDTGRDMVEYMQFGEVKEMVAYRNGLEATDRALEGRSFFDVRNTKLLTVEDIVM